jgi:hypothetical protein
MYFPVNADAIKVQVAQNDWLNRLVAWARSPNKDVRLQESPVARFLFF